jgi:hyaluronan synthase
MAPAAEPEKFQAGSMQRVSRDTGRIVTTWKGWLLRAATIAGMAAILALTLKMGIESADPLLVFSNIMPLHSILALYVGWFHYRNPAARRPTAMSGRNSDDGKEEGEKEKDDLVSVIIPVYNQKGMIETVIAALFRSTYGRIEVVAINDGSTDGSKEILDRLAAEYYPQLRVVHKKNEGKRKAVASGIGMSRGRYILLLDSDSVIDPHAVAEMIKAFKSDPKIGGAVGHVKVWNADKNLLTRLQDAWYDFSFNVGKASESTFGSVTCCSGCLAAYRRDVIQQFIRYWASSKTHHSDDRELTSYVLGSGWGKEKMEEAMVVGGGGEEKEEAAGDRREAVAAKTTTLSRRLFETAAQYDDAEDRVLTASALEKWKTVYVSTAIVYTDVPEKFKAFMRQQERWKKGYVRTNFFVSSFFWHRRNPLMALMFYIEFMATFTAPLIMLAVFLYAPLVQHEYYYSLSFVASLFFKGLAIGLDYRYRDPSAKNWKYYPLTVAVTNFVLSWVLFPALYRFRENRWLTR